MDINDQTCKPKEGFDNYKEDFNNNCQLRSEIKELYEKKIEIAKENEITTSTGIPTTTTTTPYVTQETVNLNKFLFDGTINSYKDEKKKIEKFINEIYDLIKNSSNNLDKFSDLEVLIKDVDNFDLFKNVLETKFDLYKADLRFDILKLKLKTLAKEFLVNKIPNTNWPCMYHNSENCPSDLTY